MRVLMVCTGNICRSTMAHQVLDEAVAAGGLSGAVRVDSAGVSDEEHGNPIDPRAARVLRAHGHGVPDHRARQVRADELADWDLVLAMTSSHYAALSRLRDRARPGGRAPEIRMFRDFDPQCAHLPEGPGRDKDLPDPWYGDYGDFVAPWPLSSAPHLRWSTTCAPRAYRVCGCGGIFRVLCPRQGPLPAGVPAPGLAPAMPRPRLPTTRSGGRSAR